MYSDIMSCKYQKVWRIIFTWILFEPRLRNLRLLRSANAPTGIDDRKLYERSSSTRFVRSIIKIKTDCCDLTFFIWIEKYWLLSVSCDVETNFGIVHVVQWPLNYNKNVLQWPFCLAVVILINFETDFVYCSSSNKQNKYSNK